MPKRAEFCENEREIYFRTKFNFLSRRNFSLAHKSGRWKFSCTFTPSSRHFSARYNGSQFGRFERDERKFLVCTICPSSLFPHQKFVHIISAIPGFSPFSFIPPTSDFPQNFFGFCYVEHEFCGCLKVCLMIILLHCGESFSMRNFPAVKKKLRFKTLFFKLLYQELSLSRHLVKVLSPHLLHKSSLCCNRSPHDQLSYSYCKRVFSRLNPTKSIRETFLYKQ